MVTVQLLFLDGGGPQTITLRKAAEERNIVKSVNSKDLNLPLIDEFLLNGSLFL